MYIFSVFSKIFTNIANFTNCKKFEYKNEQTKMLTNSDAEFMQHNQNTDF